MWWWCFSSTALLVVLSLASSTAYAHGSEKFSRYDFPAGFVFGAGSSAFQVILNMFLGREQVPAPGGGAAHDITTTSDQYHRYKMEMAPINPKGLQYYISLFDELTANGIEPLVTLHHNDHPQFLEDANDFTRFADVCFHHFGDRVKHWTTINEPNGELIYGYDYGFGPPERCSLNCTRGNSSTEPYLAGHNILLAHAAAVKLY
uniref:Beta-glucosidase n=1 Tax=Kalanchoe fedtschenkoi TaxID=63787 RepID=A0A7N0ZQR8_KALFE